MRLMLMRRRTSMEIERKREWHRQLAWLERRDLEKEP